MPARDLVREAPQVLHRRARSVRLDRVLPRLPVGLLVLQRLDVLRPQLPQGRARRRSARSWRRSASPASSSSTTSPSSTPSTAMAIADEIEQARHPEAVLPRDPRRRAARATRRSSRAGRSWGSAYMFLGARGDRRGGAQAVPQAGDAWARTSRRWSSRARWGSIVAVNIIADPSWDEARFAVGPGVGAVGARRSSTSPSTRRTPAPRPGTPSRAKLDHAATTGCSTSSTPCCRPSCRWREFYEELVKTQQILNRKHLGWQALRAPPRSSRGHLARGQTNFVKMLWKFGSQYDVQKLLRDHQEETRYPIALPARKADKIDSARALRLAARAGRCCDGDRPRPPRPRQQGAGRRVGKDPATTGKMVGAVGIEPTTHPCEGLVRGHPLRV